MSYCTTVRSNDEGLLQFGANAYGGFAYRAGAFESTLEENALPCVSDPTTRFITEHNFALFSRRPGLHPIVGGLVPLYLNEPLKQRGLRNRPPGNMRADCQPIRHRARNLLAGQLIKGDEEAIRIWAVNDSSDHRRLLQFDLKIENVASHSNEREKLLRVRSNEDSHQECISMQLPNEVLQLKAFDGVEGKVFKRSKRSLEIADPSEKSSISVFKSYTHSFVQIPYMNDEIAVVDSRGVLFWGHIDGSNQNPQAFSRFKNPEPLLEICSTDCPRILLSLAERELREVDLREPVSCTGHLLFDQSSSSSSSLKSSYLDGPFPDEMCKLINTSNKFWHVNQLDTQLESVLLTTTRQYILLDRRMPRIPLLAMDHAEVEGADYCLTVPPFTDPERGIRVFSLYSLTQIKMPAVSHWALAFHPQEGLWSSLGPKKLLDSPRTSTSRFIGMRRSHFDIDIAALPTITRGIHFQSLHPNLNISSVRALLFRQMEGGELWYDNVFFDPLPKLKQDVETDDIFEESGNYEGSYSEKPLSSFASLGDDCLAEILEFQRKLAERPKENFFTDVDGELLSSHKLEELSAASIFSEARPVEDFESVSLVAIDSLVGTCQTNIEEDELVSEELLSIHNADIEEKKMFSLHIEKIWHKTCDLFLEGTSRHCFQLYGELTISNGDDEEEDEEEDGEENEKTIELKARANLLKQGDDWEEDEGSFAAAKLEKLEIETKMEGASSSRKRQRPEIEEELAAMRKTAKGEEVEESELAEGTSQRELSSTLPEWMMEPRSEERKPKESRKEQERGADEEEEEEEVNEYNFEVDLGEF